MTVLAIKPYFRRPAPPSPMKGFLDVEFANIQRAIVPPGFQSVFNVALAPYFARPGTDATVAIQTAADDAASVGGGIVYLPNVYTVSASIDSGDFTTWAGGGIGGGGLKAMDGANIARGLINMSGTIGVVVDMLELDGNAANTGGHYGVFAENGERCAYRGNYIHDTIEAGIYDADQFWTEVSSNMFIACGRTGFTNNHGLMLGSIAARGSKSARIVNNYCDTAFRKGLTLFAFTPGSLTEVTIGDNIVTNCGLGGIYVATTVPAPLRNVTITGNSCYGNYTNIEISSLDGGTVSGNSCSGATGDCNINMNGVSRVAIDGNICDRAALRNILAVDCANLTITANVCTRANTSASGAIAGIDLVNTTQSIVRHNIVTDVDGNQQYGILEEGTSDFNVIADNVVANATTALYQTVGANTLCQASVGKKVGINTTAPTNTLDVNGGITHASTTLLTTSVALSNGAAGNTATMTNAPTAGNPTKWVTINDNGTPRQVPSW